MTVLAVTAFTLTPLGILSYAIIRRMTSRYNVNDEEVRHYLQINIKRNGRSPVPRYTRKNIRPTNRKRLIEKSTNLMSDTLIFTLITCTCLILSLFDNRTYMAQP